MEDFRSVLDGYTNVKVIDASVMHEQFVPLDLSVSNGTLQKKAIVSASDFEQYIKDYLSENKAKAAFGGYNEQRNIYKRSTVFNSSRDEERDIHIGLDIWLQSGTAVLAALDGVVHSFNNNSAFGDYGPTIILQHRFENHAFYTLYGHLSLASIAKLKVGQAFRKGAILGYLGEAAVNGDYAPHLHFQIIRDIGRNFGDYPGVCSKTDLPFFLHNCPDPNWLLKIK